MEIYRNTFHSDHLYLKIEDHEAAFLQSDAFEELIEKHRMPLQVMVPSDAESIIGLLERSGFRLKRKCYEMDVCAADLVMPYSTDCAALSEARRGTPDYAECAGLMYAYYADTHRQINPLTAAPADFDELLPDTVLYSRTDRQIESAAFIEGNEIAYLFSYAKDRFSRFADSLLACMFARYDRIVFEADDCDWAATRFKEMFSYRPGSSYDTYIKPCERLSAE